MHGRLLSMSEIQRIQEGNLKITGNKQRMLICRCSDGYFILVDKRIPKEFFFFDTVLEEMLSSFIGD